MTSPEANYFHYLDASAVVCLAADQEGAGRLRDYLDTGKNFILTSSSFAEAMTLLNEMRGAPTAFTDQDLRSATVQLIGLVGTNGAIKLETITPEERKWSVLVEGLARKYNLSLRDSLQLISIKVAGSQESLAKSESLLITASTSMAKVAREEGLKVWDFQSETAPPRPRLDVKGMAEAVERNRTTGGYSGYTDVDRSEIPRGSQND